MDVVHCMRGLRHNKDADLHLRVHALPCRPTASPSARTAQGSAGQQTAQRPGQTMPASCCTWRGTQRRTSLQRRRPTPCTCIAHEGTAVEASAPRWMGLSAQLRRSRPDDSFGNTVGVQAQRRAGKPAAWQRAGEAGQPAQPLPSWCMCAAASQPCAAHRCVY